MIQVNNITVEFQKPILDNFSITFPDSGVVCLFGASGCGKTTLLNVLASLIMPKKGNIQGIEGKKVSYLFQEDRLLPWLSAWENILAVHNDELLAKQLLTEAGLWEHKDKFPVQLSGGMRQRVAVARALSYQGDFFLLDEPFQGIDEKMKWSLMRFLRQRIEGKLCIFVTHDRQEAEFLSDTILMVSGPPLIIDTKRKVR